MKLATRDARYRLSFVRPNGAEHAVNRAAGGEGNPIALLGAAAKIADIRDGRRLGRLWRETLLAASSGAW